MEQSRSQQIAQHSRASQASSRKSISKYRTGSQKSEVDENLFGEPHRIKTLRENREARENSLSPQDRAFCGASLGNTFSAAVEKPEVVQVVTKDLIRKIRIPRAEDPSGQSIILHQDDLDRIISSATVITNEEKVLKKKELEEEKNKHQEHVHERKNEFQTLENTRRTTEKSDLEQETETTRRTLIQRSTNLMEEQDDEIKNLNEVILNAKCHAIRDAQMTEKEQIKSEMNGEEKRLDKMMEIDRLKALQDYEKREQQRHRQRLLGAQLIQHQIQSREQEQLLENEKKDQETKSMLEYLERLQIEDMKEMDEKVSKQQILMNDIKIANDEIQRQKLQKKEQEKLAEMKVLEYIKEKEQREMGYQLEQEKLASEKEIEIARLRQQQERAKDVQAEKDALRAKRNQEQFERDWRKKQKELTSKKLENDTQLKVARHRQVKDKEHFLALQAQRDRAEFERVLVVQQKLQKKDSELATELTHKNLDYSEQVRNQIKSKEDERLKTRKDYFEEGIRLDQEAKERRRKLDEIKMRKLQELKNAGIPDKYTAQVHRRINDPQPVSFTMS